MTLFHLLAAVFFLGVVFAIVGLVVLTYADKHLGDCITRLLGEGVVLALLGWCLWPLTLLLAVIAHLVRAARRRWRVIPRHGLG